eukprot:6183824-Pleurochrysis_carterae.AAC.1
MGAGKRGGGETGWVGAGVNGLWRARVGARGREGDTADEVEARGTAEEGARRFATHTSWISQRGKVSRLRIRELAVDQGQVRRGRRVHPVAEVEERVHQVAWAHADTHTRMYPATCTLFHKAGRIGVSIGGDEYSRV